MNSIRRNLLLALLGAMFVVMLLGGWATYKAARDEAGTLFDYHLQQIALSPVFYTHLDVDKRQTWT